MTTTEANVGTERLSCRINAEIKHRAEEAAALLGQSVTAFTEAALAEKAQAVLLEHQRLAVSERDFSRFVEIINAAEPPTPKLVDAMRQFEEMRSQNNSGTW